VDPTQQRRIGEKIRALVSREGRIQRFQTPHETPLVLMMSISD